MPSPRRTTVALRLATTIALAAALWSTSIPTGSALDAGTAGAGDGPVRDDPVELTTGHLDIGPRVVDGRWRLLVRDDTGAAPTWREPASTVLRLGDAAAVEVPDDPSYSFLGTDPGTTVHVAPQTQDPEVIWIGWNAQDPEVADRVDRGLTLRLLDVRGPGELSVHLQAGNFGAPEVLWDSRADDPGSIWVDARSHSHANWVFSRPGVHLVRVEASATLRDGSTVRDVADLVVAVGGDGDTAQVLELAAALAADPDPASSGGPTGEPSEDPAEDPAEPADGSGWIGDGTAPLLLAAASVASVLLTAVLLGARRSARLRRAAADGVPR